jgi:hypothetical protein
MGKGVKVSTPFINAFQNKKDFLNVDSTEDTKVANTYPFEFLNILEVNGMPSRCLFVCLVVLLGGKGVRVNMPFINAFQKKKTSSMQIP